MLYSQLEANKNQSINQFALLYVLLQQRIIIVIWITEVTPANILQLDSPNCCLTVDADWPPAV